MVSLQNVRPGMHTLTAVPALDDHAEVTHNARSVMFDYVPATPLPAVTGVTATGQPSITIVSPKPGATVTGTFTVAVQIKNLRVSYRSIPTLGRLFLLQVVMAFGLAAAVLATGSRLIVAASVGFALATLGGYLLSVWAGLFGFKEIRTTAGIVAGVIEVAAFAALAALAAAPATPGQRARPAPAANCWPGCRPAYRGRDGR